MFGGPGCRCKFCDALKGCVCESGESLGEVVAHWDLESAAALNDGEDCRDAWADCMEMLEQHWRRTGLGGILHCFTSTLEDARRGLDMGFQISFAGNSTYPKTQNLRDIAKGLPLEKILIKTDSPYLAPQPYRGKRNEPAYVVEVARTLANVRDLPPEEFAAATAANFRRFFRLEKPAVSQAEMGH